MASAVELLAARAPSRAHLGEPARGAERRPGRLRRVPHHHGDGRDLCPSHEHRPRPPTNSRSTPSGCSTATGGQPDTRLTRGTPSCASGSGGSPERPAAPTRRVATFPDRSRAIGCTLRRERVSPADRGRANGTRSLWADDGPAAGMSARTNSPALSAVPVRSSSHRYPSAEPSLGRRTAQRRRDLDVTGRNESVRASELAAGLGLKKFGTYPQSHGGTPE